jgi:hypothetical protein
MTTALFDVPGDELRVYESVPGTGHREVVRLLVYIS